MPGGSDGPAPGSTVSSEAPGMVPNQLAVLVPTFDPAKDDVMVYSQKVQLLIQAWPDGRWTELATRLILGCSGSAFMKLQMHQAEVTKNEKKSIEKIITILGGQWGQINLEKRYEYAEKAIYKCYQKSDESADSYLARADILWSELQAKGVTLEDLQPYVTLRGSQLTPEDKKKVLIDVDAANTGKLTIAKVSAAIRMLGATFFHDMTGQRKTRGKTYDQGTLIAEDVEMEETSQPIFATESVDPFNEEEAMEILVQEGDEDATLVADFEDSIQELVQGDEELAATYTAYTDARKRLSDKFKSRGFWPPSSSQKGGKSKGSFKGAKGKFGKGNGSNYSGRKSLQQRILESRCRLCNRIGHWKAECPLRSDAASSVSRSTGAPTSYVQAEASGDVEHLPLEFLQLPESLPPIDEPLSKQPAECFSLVHNPQSRIRQYLMYLKGCSRVATPTVRTDVMEGPRPVQCHDEKPDREPSETSSKTAVSCFASHGSLGVVDLGATKTVIGSNNIKELIDSLIPEIRNTIYRCKCQVTFRFGNHGTLKSEQALVIPIHGFHLKVAIVQGSTPFLLSNTLLRALGAIIDTSKQELFASTIKKVIPLHLTEKGLFLLDINDLATVQAGQKVEEMIAETHNVTEPKDDVCSEGSENNHESQNNNPHWSASESEIQDSQSSNTEIQDIQGSSTMSKHHKKSQHKSPCSINPAIPEDQSEKPFAKSFSLPHRSSKHVVFDEETSEGADTRRGEQTRSVSLFHPGSREDDHRLWQEAPGVHFQGSLDHGPTVDRLVCGPLPQLQEEQSLPVSSLCGADGGEGRIDRAKGTSDDSTTGSARDWSGCWEAIPQAKGSGKSSRISHTDSRADDSRAQGGTRDRGGVGSQRYVRDHPGGGELSSGPFGNSNAPYGKCPHPSDSAPREHELQAGQSELSDREADHQLLCAGDLSSDCMALETTERCRERKRFYQLLTQYSQELSSCQSTFNQKSTKRSQGIRTVFEVFCGSSSQLSQQCQQLGMTAVRFSRDRCDLQSHEGRQVLFQELIGYQPRHLWFSPSCGPWSGWSNINGQKSIEHWEQLHQDRLKHLEQVALGMVLLRYQTSLGNHFSLGTTSYLIDAPFALLV